jgi:Uma2 family endonuclease
MFSSLVDTGQVPPASFSTSRPQIIYLLVKYSIQPFMFSLEKKNRIAPAISIREGEKKQKYEHFFGGEIFELVKWLVYRRQHLCAIAIESAVDTAQRERCVPRSDDCFAIPRDASRSAKFPYIPS